MAMTKEQMTKAAQDRKQQKQLTDVRYLQLKAEGVSDAKIMSDYCFSPKKFEDWKRANNLETLKIAKDLGEEEAAQKTNKDTKKENEAKKDPLQALQSKLDYATKRNKTLEEENRKLAEENKRLFNEKSNDALIESQTDEIKKLNQRLIELKKYERDYMQLEVENKNLRSKYHGIENDLEEFKDTEDMLVRLMRRYTKIYDRAEEMA